MTRKIREKSGTGVYHVMLRGVNKQIIFEDEQDFIKFRTILRQQVWPTDELGKLLPSRCHVYAYCLMPNHVHLLIKEASDDLATVVKRISVTYALYFNVKYEHCGHLFQNRFRSEPVNGYEYFFTLLRYIHQNPIAAGLCQTVSHYEWSSWGEYERSKVGIQPAICSVESVLKRISLEELTGLVNTLLAKSESILDYDNEGRSRTDTEVVDYFASTFGLQVPSNIQLYSKERRNDILRQAKEFGASIRQLSRITGISIGVIRNL